VRWRSRAEPPLSDDRKAWDIKTRVRRAKAVASHAHSKTLTRRQAARESARSWTAAVLCRFSQPSGPVNSTAVPIGCTDQSARGLAQSKTLARRRGRQRRSADRGVVSAASRRVGEATVRGHHERAMAGGVRIPRGLGVRWRSRAEPPLWRGTVERARSSLPRPADEKRWQATRTPRPRGLRTGPAGSRQRLVVRWRSRAEPPLSDDRKAWDIKTRVRRAKAVAAQCISTAHEPRPPR